MRSRLTWRHLLLRLWVVLTLGWCAIVCWQFYLACDTWPDDPKGMRCTTGQVAPDNTKLMPYLVDTTLWDWRLRIVDLVWFPVATLVGLAAVLWASALIERGRR